MTLQDGEEYCMNLNGHVFEPETSADVDFLHETATKFDLPELWVGFHATSGTVPRSKSEWKASSNPSKVITDEIFGLLDQDNGVSFVGKF